MASFLKKTMHPVTRKIETAIYLDNYFGPHEYAILFKDGACFKEETIGQVRRPTRRLKREEMDKYIDMWDHKI